MPATHQLIDRGLRYGDICTIIPPAGPRRKLRLNRTSWDILPEGESTTGHPTILIPGAHPRAFKWRLELTELSPGESRFVLRSLDGRPFVLNGQWVRDAFVEARDTLSSDGYGRVEFSAHTPLDQFRPPQFPAVLDDERAMHSGLPVLLQGETGTGKGHFAREIHRRSGRSGPFIAINAQAFSSGLVEAELFGHKKGAFTGATHDRKGAIAQAHGGTLFLDEVDSLPRELQTKLLLFLDDQRYRPVGSEREEQGQVRLIFASGRPLSQLVAKGEVRADFFFRLGLGITIELRPLRESPQEIRRHCELFGIEYDVSVGERLVQFYESLPWPGNVRQLRGHLQLKKVRARSRKLDFDTCDESLMTMSSDLHGLQELAGAIRPMDEVKRAYATWAMQRGHNELGWTAKQLGVNPKTLRQWLSA